MYSSVPPPMSRVGRRRNRVLIVDDDPTVVRGLVRVLKNAHPGLKIETAKNGVEAMEALSGATYDVVVTDLRMPNGGGMNLLESLALHHPETIRIVHTSQGESAETRQARSLAHALLTKPAPEADFLSAIERGLEARTAVPSSHRFGAEH
jgi:DNA-binding NtrC family response regulator